MTETERLNKLINILCQEKSQYHKYNIPEDLHEKRKFLRALLNVRPPKPVSEEFLKLQDEELQEQLHNKGVITVDNGSNKLKYVLWQGDITRLKVDAIVNAANSQMLGCFIPLHRCIDNAIHSSAGVQLRLACQEIMRWKGTKEPTGKALITPAFNLPAKYVIHTVGPIVKQFFPTKQDCELLASCYRSCLEIADNNNLKSIAFCCISTGEFSFPNKEAAEIALSTINKYFSEHPDPTIKTIVFNTFKNKDFQIYSTLLNQYSNFYIFK